MLILRSIFVALFTFAYGLASLLAIVFVFPFVVIKEKWQLLMKKSGKSKSLAVLAILLLPVLSISLTGCTAESTLSVQSTLDTVKDAGGRAAEFAAGAPDAPYASSGSQEVYASAVKQQGLQLSAEQLGYIGGSASALGVDVATVGLIIEKELRNLDSGELDRDVLSALAGDNSSIGMAQVRVSTAEEIEKEDTTGLLPLFIAGEEGRDDRIRRLAADDWSALYASSYVGLLSQRFPGDGPLGLAARYTGRVPGNANSSDQALLDVFQEVFSEAL